MVYELYLHNTIEKQKQNEAVLSKKIKCIIKKKILIKRKTGVSSKLT